MFAPKATPADIIANTEKAIREILSEPATADRLREGQQMTLTLGGPKELGAFFAKQVAIWSPVVKENNIRP